MTKPMDDLRQARKDAQDAIVSTLSEHIDTLKALVDEGKVESFVFRSTDPYEGFIYVDVAVEPEKQAMLGATPEALGFLRGKNTKQPLNFFEEKMINPEGKWDVVAALDAISDDLCLLNETFAALKKLPAVHAATLYVKNDGLDLTEVRKYFPLEVPSFYTLPSAPGDELSPAP